MLVFAVRRCSYWKGKTLRTAIQKKDAFAPSTAGVSGLASVSHALEMVLASLEDSKAESIIPIDIRGKSALGDYMVIASGRSHRHVAAVADHLLRTLKEAGYGNAKVEGLTNGDWVLIDTGDIIIHLFRPEVREFYNIEKMWLAPDLDGEFEAETVH
ncbi:ribosome silencing factor [Phyllobacterium phragmitis]